MIDQLDNIRNAAYIVAAILFIYGLKMLARHRSARKGNLVSAIGMLIAMVTVLVGNGINWTWIIVGLLAGTLIGALAAHFVKMTAMPEMVALFNGSGGLASLLVGWAEYHRMLQTGVPPLGPLLIISLTVLIGGVTFTGSVVAWGKLSEKLSSKPFLYPGQKFVNALILLAIVAAIACNTPLAAILGWSSPYPFMIALIILSGILGITSVAPIGGGICRW